MKVFEEGALKQCFSHGTPHGMIHIKPDIVAGSIVWRIFLNEREIAVSASILAPVYQIAEGRFDAQLGFAASKLGLPSDMWLWRVTPNQPNR